MPKGKIDMKYWYEDWWKVNEQRYEYRGNYKIYDWLWGLWILSFELVILWVVLVAAALAWIFIP